MEKCVKLRAYAEGNLGDDLFIEIICNRYSKTQFYLCGSQKYSKIYNKIPNLKYIAYDTLSIRARFALKRKMKKMLNRLLGCEEKCLETTDFAIEEKYSKKADYNVFITGSGFMNSESEFESLQLKYIDEEKYYKRKPYVLGCNFGPYAHKEYLEMYRALFQYASDVCFRDKYSAMLFSEIKHVRNEADIVFGYPLEKIKVDTNKKGKDFLVISVANIKKDKDDAVKYYEEYISMIRELVCYRNNKGMHTVLVGFSNEQKDNETINEILEGIKNSELNQVYCYPDSADIDLIMNVFMQAEAVVATRYHAMVLALLMKKKCCTICYNEKVKHVIQEIDKDAHFIDLDEMREITPFQMENEKMYQITDEKWLMVTRSAKEQFVQLDKVLK